MTQVKRVLVATYGTRGDVEPMVALAREVRALGAEVRVCAPPDEEIASLVARAGMPLVAFDRTWRSWATRPSTAEERVVSVDGFVAEHIAATHDTVVRAAQGCDVLVATGMLHFVARSAAEVAGVPHRFAVFSPDVLAPQGWQPSAAAPLNAHRVALGLPPVADVRELLFTARPWVAADPILSPPRAGDDDALLRTPAWILPDDRPLPPDLVAFLDAGAPPVHVGFGSMRVAQESAAATIDAVRAQGRRVVLSRGWAGLTATADDCFAVGEINQQALFRRVAAVVHHGGAGTTTAAAAAGAPQVIVPQAADQPRWASRMAELGIGAAHDGPVPTAESLGAALSTALAPATRERAAAVAAEIRTDGAEMAARLLVSG